MGLHFNNKKYFKGKITNHGSYSRVDDQTSVETDMTEGWLQRSQLVRDDVIYELLLHGLCDKMGRLVNNYLCSVQ